MQDSLTITLGVTLFALMDFSEIKTRIYLNELHSKISNSKTTSTITTKKRMEKLKSARVSKVWMSSNKLEVE